jgi:hypothetical protein
MPTDRVNDRSIQHSFRLPLDLNERLEAYARHHGMARNAAVVELLEQSLRAESHLRDTPTSQGVIQRNVPRDAPLHHIAFEQRLAAVEATLEALQAQRAPSGGVAREGLNEATQFLGPLCERGHDWQGTGQSRRSRRNWGCMQCEVERTRAKRAAKKTQSGVQRG